MAEPATEPTRSPSPAILELMALDERSLPCTDDMPLPDSDQQGDPVYYTKLALRHHFRHRDDVAVSADIFMYYLPLHGAEPDRDGRGRPVYPRLGPDGLVSFGVPRRDRDSYVVYKEGKPPDLVLEVASRSRGGATMARSAPSTKRSASASTSCSTRVPGNGAG